MITTTYAADGSYSAQSQVPERGPLGPIAVTQRGRWAIEGDRLVTSEVVTEARAVDGNTRTDAFAKASAQMSTRWAPASPPPARCCASTRGA